MAKVIRRAILRGAVLGGVAAATLMAGSFAAWAENVKVRFAYLVADSMLRRMLCRSRVAALI